MRIGTITYRGPGRTIHPELGELVPHESREIPERDIPAALAALAAGLPIEVAISETEALVEEDGPSAEAVVETSALDFGAEAELESEEE